MAKSIRRIFQLARASSRSDDEVLAIVRSLGISATSSNSLVPSQRLNEVDRALGIDRVRLSIRRERQPELIAENSLVEPQQPVEIVAVAPPPEPKPRLPKWATVGHPVAGIRHLTAEEVEQIHWLLVADFKRAKDPIEPPGVRSRDLLESALYRARTAIGDDLKYPTIAMAAAAKLHALIHNHPFHNGNKRTALVSNLVFLDLNKYVLTVKNEDELFEYVLRIAAHEVSQENGLDLGDAEMLDISRWLHHHIRLIDNAEKPLPARRLKSILLRYGCRFEQPRRGNRIDIYRADRWTQVHYRDDGSEVQRNTIRKIREDLGLTDADGYDSAIFYEASDRVPEFVHRYRRTLDRLATL